MRNYKQAGDIISVIAPYSVTPGAGVLVGAIFGIAVNRAAQGDPVELLREGVVSVVKPSAESWAQGAPIFWNNSTRIFTTGGGSLVGLASDSYAASVTTGGVLLQSSGGTVSFATSLTGGIELSVGGEALKVGAQGYTDRVPAIFGGQRIRGNSGYVTGNSGITTQSFKIEAEAPFSAVRVWYGEKNTSGTMPVIEALVAATETGAFNTVANAVLPIKGGATFNNLATTTHGWRRATFAGANSISPTPNLIANNGASYVVSDWIPCASLPRVDVSGARPMALLRIANTGVGVYTTGNGTMTSYNSARGTAPHREMLVAGTPNDGINTITNIPATAPTGIGWEMYAWLEFMYDVPVRSVVIVGDSTSEASSNAMGTSWALRALREISTPASPISVMNFAGSGHSHAQYLTLLDGALSTGMRPTDVIFQGWSQNGFGGHDKGAEDLIGRDMQYLLKLRDLGIKVWMTNAYGVNGYAGAQEAARLRCLAKIASWAASGLVTLINTDSIVTDYSGGAGILKAEYNSGDNVHANNTAQILMGDALKAVWN